MCLTANGTSPAELGRRIVTCFFVVFFVVFWTLWVSINFVNACKHYVDICWCDLEFRRGVRFSGSAGQEACRLPQVAVKTVKTVEAFGSVWKLVLCQDVPSDFHIFPQNYSGSSGQCPSNYSGKGSVDFGLWTLVEAPKSGHWFPIALSRKTDTQIEIKLRSHWLHDVEQPHVGTEWSWKL